jgi:hypothetical protein
MKFETHAKVTIALAVVAALAGAINFLALNDIYHQEGDLKLEWSVVRYTNFIFLVFLFSSVSTVWRALRGHPERKCDEQTA